MEYIQFNHAGRVIVAKVIHAYKWSADVLVEYTDPNGRKVKRDLKGNQYTPTTQPKPKAQRRAKRARIHSMQQRRAQITLSAMERTKTQGTPDKDPTRYTPEEIEKRERRAARKPRIYKAYRTYRRVKGKVKPTIHTKATIERLAKRKAVILATWDNM